MNATLISNDPGMAVVVRQRDACRPECLSWRLQMAVTEPAQDRGVYEEESGKESGSVNGQVTCYAIFWV